MRLSALQDAYSQAIYSTNTEPLESLIHGTMAFTTRSRVEIYRNNTLGSLENTLHEVFPVCEALVGENYFKQLTSAHILNNPSKDRNLDEYGARFPQTLASLIESRNELHSLFYLADVARLEWLVHHSYYAEDRSVFDLENFSLLSAEQQTQAHFKLADDISFMDSPYPVYAIWLKHQKDNHPDDTNHIEGEININDTQHCYILVQRQQRKTNVQIVDKGFYHLIQAINQRTALMDLTGFLEDSPTAIAELIQQGMVAGFEVEAESRIESGAEDDL